MLLPKFECLRPSTVEEACSFLEESKGEAAVLAGGTDLIIELSRRLRRPRRVVGLKQVKGLNHIRKDDSGSLRIGALATLHAVESSDLIFEEYRSLAQAIRLAAVPPIRQMATVGGNLSLDTRCIYYNQSDLWRRAQADCFKLGGDVCHAMPMGRRCLSVYQGDLPPILMALGAKVRIASASGERTIPLAGFFTGRGEKPNALEPGEILLEVIVPSSESGKKGHTLSAYEKLRVREGMDFPMAGVAVSLETDGRGAVGSARIVLSAIGSTPVEVPEAANLLAGNIPDEDLLEQVGRLLYEKAHPAANLAMDPWYRKKMVKVLAKRAIRKALASWCAP